VAAESISVSGSAAVLASSSSSLSDRFSLYNSDKSKGRGSQSRTSARGGKNADLTPALKSKTKQCGAIVGGAVCLPLGMITNCTSAASSPAVTSSSAQSVSAPSGGSNKRHKAEKQPSSSAASGNSDKRFESIPDSNMPTAAEEEEYSMFPCQGCAFTDDVELLNNSFLKSFLPGGCALLPKDGLDYQPWSKGPIMIVGYSETKPGSLVYRVPNSGGEYEDSVCRIAAKQKAKVIRWKAESSVNNYHS